MQYITNGFGPLFFVTAIGCSSQLEVSSQSARECNGEACGQDTTADAGDVTDKPDIVTIDNPGVKTCTDPSLDRIREDVQVRLCNGQLANGTIPVCKKDGETGCLTTENFPAVKIEEVSRAGIAVVASINGQPGLLPECAADLAENCRTTTRFKAAERARIVSSLIKADESVAGVTGSLDTACSSAEQTGCLANNDYPSVKAQDFISPNIAKDMRIGSLNGDMKVVRRCRNSARLARLDAFAPSNLVFTLPRSGVSVAADTFTFAGPHGMKTGFPLRMTGTPIPQPLVVGTPYYAIVDPAFPAVARLAATEADAIAGNFIDIIDQGSDSQTVRPFGDGLVGYHDLIDDFANGAATHPVDLFWSPEELCAPDNFEKMSPSAGLTPSGTVVTYATVAWTEIWRDLTTGLLFTNPLYKTSGSTMQADAIKLCSSLDSGDGAGKWYLPTQKELISLYLNGVSRAPISNMDYMALWSSTQVKDFPANAWEVYGTLGAVAHGLRINTSYGVLCVRY